MAVIKGVEVIGIERIEGKRKADSKPFGFWQLHCIANDIYQGSGRRVLRCNMNDKDYQTSCVVPGSLITVYERGQYVDFIDTNE